LLHTTWSPRLERVSTSWCVVPSPGMRPVTYRRSLHVPSGMRRRRSDTTRDVSAIALRITPLTTAGPYASSISSICSRMARRPARALLTFSRMLSGSRLARTNVSTMSQRTVPCSAIFTGGIATLSSKKSRALTAHPPASTPPMSPTCSVLKTQQKSLPSQKTGA
jgi:hypothetical protein